MPSLKFLARRLADRTFGTEFDRALSRAGADSRKRFLFFWNRGLGDIALGLVPLFLRIRQEYPGAKIEVVTREELRAAFELTNIHALHVVKDLQRETRVKLAAEAPVLGIELDRYCAVFEYPDPNRWLAGRRNEYPPTLAWNRRWDTLAERFKDVASDRIVIGAHVHSETASYYGYVKDWPAESWAELLGRFTENRVQWVLFGNRAEVPLTGPNVLDLRGDTGFAELMSLIKNRCRILLAPDSGILTMTYFLDAPFALEVISLWSDPRQGILLQDCASPNPRLHHVALRSPGEDVRRLPIDEVEKALLDAIART
jgi:ADP-heptose:LPS heptosyltransferase